MFCSVPDCLVQECLDVLEGYPLYDPVARSNAHAAVGTIKCIDSGCGPLRAHRLDLLPVEYAERPLRPGRSTHLQLSGGPGLIHCSILNGVEDIYTRFSQIVHNERVIAT